MKASKARSILSPLLAVAWVGIPAAALLKYMPDPLVEPAAINGVELGFFMSQAMLLAVWARLRDPEFWFAGALELVGSAFFLLLDCGAALVMSQVPLAALSMTFGKAHQVALPFLAGQAAVLLLILLEVLSSFFRRSAESET